MAVRSTDLFVLLDQIGNDNAAGEYYLPDIVMLPGAQSAVIEAEAWEVAGVNSRAELAGVEAVWQDRRRAEAMRDGATLIAPRSEEHTSELQSLMRTSYAVFCLKKKKKNDRQTDCI